MVQLLDLNVEAHRTILEQLPVQHLSALSGTCRHFRSCVFEGRFAEKLWRNRCEEQVGEGFLSLHQAGLPHQLAPTARYWRHLWYHADRMEDVRWWKGGSDIINQSADQADARALEDGDVPGPPMKARLARSGHLSSVIGHLMVVSGGILRDGSLCVDLVILDLLTLTFIKPEVYGEVPMTRFRHTGVVVAPQLSSTIQQSVNQLLHPAKRDASQGSVILLFGGYNTMGQEFGGDKFEAVWVAHDGSAVAWVSAQTSGHAPSARFHHTTTLCDGGKQIILYGGEGHEMIDGAGGQPPNVYTMDIASLTWHKRSTTCTTVDESPGVRSLHIVTVRENPDTKHEELVVIAGYCSNVLATMHPHRLDLITWQWFKEPGLVPNPGPGDALMLPISRQRAAGEVVGKKWMLMHAGSPTQFLQGNFLEDVNKLHLPSLTWRQPPAVHGRPARALRNIAGHSLEGLIAFGGCIPTIMGIMPVAKTDPLLIGPPPPLHLLLERDLVTPSCTLPPMAPSPPEVPEVPGVPFGAYSRPPPDALPDPSGATVSDLTRREHQAEPQSWQPELDAQLYERQPPPNLPHFLGQNEAGTGMCIPLSFPPLAAPTPTTSDVDPAGSEYRGTSARAPIPVDTSALPQPLHLSPPGLASALPSPGGASTATPERLWPNVNPQSHAGQQAAATSASGSAADRRHVSQSHTPLQRFTQATMAAWPAAADVVGVGLAAPSHRYSQGHGRTAATSHAQWTNVPSVAQLDTLQVVSRPSALSLQVVRTHVGVQLDHRQEVADQAGPSRLPSSSLPLVAPARSSSTARQATEQPSSSQHTVSSFVPWRPATLVPDYQRGQAPAAAPTYWRHEATGEFFTRQENDHHEVFMMPAQVASSDSSDSVGSPNTAAAFAPEEDLNQMPPNGQAQNQGPCLMQ